MLQEFFGGGAPGVMDRDIEFPPDALDDREFRRAGVGFGDEDERIDVHRNDSKVRIGNAEPLGEHFRGVLFFLMAELGDLLLLLFLVECGHGEGRSLRERGPNSSYCTSCVRRSNAVMYSSAAGTFGNSSAMRSQSSSEVVAACFASISASDGSRKDMRAVTAPVSGSSVSAVMG